MYSTFALPSRAQVKAGHGISGASRVRATCVPGRIRGEVEGAALISSAMNTHACELVFDTGAEGVLSLDPGEDVVDCPGSAGGQIVNRIGRGRCFPMCE